MSLHPQTPVPEEPARIACAAVLHGTLNMRIRDALGTMYRDDGTDLYLTDGDSAEYL
jgi:hypothetical protein